MSVTLQCDWPDCSSRREQDKAVGWMVLNEGIGAPREERIRERHLCEFHARDLAFSYFRAVAEQRRER